MPYRDMASPECGSRGCHLHRRHPLRPAVPGLVSPPIDALASIGLEIQALFAPHTPPCAPPPWRPPKGTTRSNNCQLGDTVNGYTLGTDLVWYQVPRDYRPGDLANGHILGADGVWRPVSAATHATHCRRSRSRAYARARSGYHNAEWLSAFFVPLIGWLLAIVFTVIDNAKCAEVGKPPKYGAIVLGLVSLVLWPLVLYLGRQPLSGYAWTGQRLPL